MYKIEMPSSAGSSPRRANSKQITNSPLHSSWIQRIIPLSHQAAKDEHSDQSKEEVFKYNDQKMHLFHPMDTDDEEDVEDQEDDSGKLKQNNDDRSSWLSREIPCKQGTVRGHARDNSLDFRTVHVRHGEDPKAVPVRYSEALKVAKVVPVTDDMHMERCKEDGSSAWFTRIAKKDEDGLTAAKHTVKPSFPPLKSGEQWPGTLKPSNLPPLRIPSNRSLGEDKEKPRASDEEVRTISLFDEQKQASCSSETCSLPSAFVTEVYQKGCHVSDSGATSSMRFMPRRIAKHGSCSSDTKSLFKDRLSANGDDEASSHEIQEVDSCLNMKGNRLLGTTNMMEPSMSKCKNDKVLLHSQSAKHDVNKSLEVRLFRAADEAKQNTYMPNTSLIRKEHILNGGGSQQWLQRWCPTNSNITRHQKP